MAEILIKNLNVIEKRWPDIFIKIQLATLDSLTVTVEKNTLLINDIQLTSSYNREAEAQVQAKKIPLTSTRAFVYGVGLGDVQLNLLERKTLTSLSVCIFNFDLLLHTLNVIDQTKWLTDPRVNLITAKQLEDVYMPFVALPTELIFCDDESATLRDRVMLELDQEYANRQHTFDNIEVVKQINQSLSLIEHDYDVQKLFNSISGQVYIVAAGPTLNEHIDRLKKNRLSEKPILLIAVDAAVKTLSLSGIIPDVVVTIDAMSQGMFANVAIKQFAHSKLVYFPRGEKQFVIKWPGKRYCAYSSSGLYDEINKKYPRGKLASFGSVIHPSTDLAIKMGATEIIFLGADFGFTDGKVYANGQDHPYMESFLNSKHWVLNGKGEKITTMLNYRNYLRDLERYIETKPNVKFLNGSDKGAYIKGTELLK